MKKFLFVLFALVGATFNAAAQQSAEKSSSGARIAVGLSGRVFPTMALTARMVGPGLDFDCFWDRVIGPIDFGIGLGADYMLGLPEEGVDAGISGVDIQLPIRLRYGYRFEGGPRLMVFGEIVPFFGALLQQKTNNSTVDLYTDQFKRFDLMAGGGVGIIFGDKFRINVGGDIGLLNRRISGLSVGRNYQGYLSFAYLF